MASRSTAELLAKLSADLAEIRRKCLSAAKCLEVEIDRIPPECRAAAHNLLHYVSLREHDLRDTQLELATIGLSSLERIEPHVLDTLDAVLTVLHKLTATKDPRITEELPPVTVAAGTGMTRRNAERLFGPLPRGRSDYIMVTMPTEAAAQYGLVRELLEAGMNVMRINCAHDDPATWQTMIDNLRRAERELGSTCRILMELAGPKLRTGRLKMGSRVLRWKPQRDYRGLVVTPARIWFCSEPRDDSPSKDKATVLPIGDELVLKARVDDLLHLRDIRGRHRELKVVDRRKDGFWAECDRTAYVGAGTSVVLVRGTRELITAHIGDLPRIEEPLWLSVGDRVILTDTCTTGCPARWTSNGTVLKPAHVVCMQREIYRYVRVGERVFFDDGLIAGLVSARSSRKLEIVITHARVDGSKLGSNKGINFPDSKVLTPSKSDKDLADLDFAISHADMVGLSFIRDPSEVAALHQRLRSPGRPKLGVVLKIETRVAFEQLPAILLAGMLSPRVAVMIARGDLAVELGFERLADAQEEILRHCEAAHMPTIVATQILETLAKKGVPTRPELLDVAMSGRGQCVMLNKGPHLVEAVQFLDRLLQRSESYPQQKKAMIPPFKKLTKRY